MELREIQKLKDYKKEEYGYFRYYVKRDILRRVSFDDYGEFIKELQAYAKTRVGNTIAISHVIHYGEKQFSVRFDLPAALIPNLTPEENIFLDHTVAKYYLDDNEYPMITYIKKKQIDDYIDLL